MIRVDDFLTIMSGILDLFKMPINVYGFEFSLWDVIVVSLMACILLRFIVRLFE